MRTESVVFAPYVLEPDGRDETVAVVEAPTPDGGRDFLLTTTAPQREGGPQRREIREAAGDLAVRSASPLFDALFAQAIDDARLNSVASIRDGAYNGGEAIPCDCFQTGEKWTYVWTRDVAYAADLGLAVIDPARAATSLLFKTSPFRDSLAVPDGLPADGWQIVQDTGSGGSWPVSSDRVAWAVGAEAVLLALDGDDRRAFAAAALRALRGTIAADRAAVFDAGDGLYRGEQSFLDWRSQTYAPWVIDDIAAIAGAKALSTNVCHQRALALAARLADEDGDTAAAARYAGWAADLKAAINRMFWLPERGLYASLTTPDSPALPIEKFDMLGEALAIVSGIADDDRARTILANYPHAPFGAPVYYPAQPDVRVYHNRALWPFVTAYALMAAARAGAVAAADHAFDALLRAAALHLDNVENQEWLTGRTAFDDGPEISSRRQLWSVGGYLGMVAKVVFGCRAEPEGLAVAPFLTARMRDRLGGDEARLVNLVHRRRRLTIVLHLPPAAPAASRYPVARVTVDGTDAAGVIADDRLADGSRIEVWFGAPLVDDAGLTLMPAVPARSHDDPRVFSPREPAITDLVVTGAAVRLNFSGQSPRSGREAPLRFTILRDGAVAARDLEDTVWFDPLPLRPGIRRSYRVVAAFRDGGNASHPSLAAVIDVGAVTTVGVDDRDVERRDGRLVFPLSVRAAGTYALDLAYVNHLFHIQTGVTNAVKRVTLRDAAGRTVAAGVVQMPHMTPVNRLGRSTALAVDLAPGDYRIEIADYFNMSWLAANATYISPGGASGPLNDADIRALNLTRTG